MAKAGLFILISSKNIAAQDALEAYYNRIAIEQIFGFAKDDLTLLPIRCQSDSTIRGYLFLQYLLLIVFLEMGEKLLNNFTVAQGILMFKALKCKIYDHNNIVIQALKKQKQIFDSFSISVPIKFTGIQDYHILFYIN